PRTRMRCWTWDATAPRDAFQPIRKQRENKRRTTSGSTVPSRTSPTHRPCATLAAAFRTTETRMNRPIACALALAIAASLGGNAAHAAQQQQKQEASSSMSNATIAYSGPFAAPSTLDLNYPQFDRINDSDFGP